MRDAIAERQEKVRPRSRYHKASSNKYRKPVTDKFHQSNLANVGVISFIIQATERILIEMLGRFILGTMEQRLNNLQSGRTNGSLSMS